LEGKKCIVCFFFKEHAKLRWVQPISLCKVSVCKKKVWSETSNQWESVSNEKMARMHDLHVVELKMMRRMDVSKIFAASANR